MRSCDVDDDESGPSGITFVLAANPLTADFADTPCCLENSSNLDIARPVHVLAAIALRFVVNPRIEKTTAHESLTSPDAYLLVRPRSISARANLYLCVSSPLKFVSPLLYLWNSLRSRAFSQPLSHSLSFLFGRLLSPDLGALLSACYSICGVCSPPFICCGPAVHFPTIVA